MRAPVAPPRERGPVGRTMAEVGDLAAFCGYTLVAGVRALLGGRLPAGELTRQLWFLASVTTLPSILVMLPFGVAVSLNVGSLAAQIGAEAYGGAVVAFLIIGQAGPMVCALMIAGVGGSAITADLGARRIREETDALEVMGISTVTRLVVPRVIAAVVVSVLLCAVLMVVGIGASLLFHVWVLDGTAGGFLGTLTRFASPADFVSAELKAAAFGLLSALVAGYKGLTVRGGPQGVGNAVNEAVVLAFIAVFVANAVISQVFGLIVPARGEY
ncbi:MlaE family ABC transporter permease [Amycolatopsis suaedae]|uniref:ABC transporter permease n=1 Tax=Amycolatopsis suaedae TaxID=2510978 RepID=A0A4Q7J9G0_9PSEU|nr:ABC transporter permease [Amycolatopsis suaedae]RZQ63859.1 ABC transporter permease [Amycolatopsis suaedae]